MRKTLPHSAREALQLMWAAIRLLRRTQRYHGTRMKILVDNGELHDAAHQATHKKLDELASDKLVVAPGYDISQDLPFRCNEQILRYFAEDPE